MKKKVNIVGSGIAGLSGAAMLASQGWDVSVLEKNDTLGGRMRAFQAQGFTFDMGPSWYWMEEVFENFFNKFGKTTSDFYELKKLDPGFSMIFEDEEIKVPASYQELKVLFEDIEAGAGEKLDQFMEEAEYKYKTGMESLVFQPGLSITEFFSWDIVKGVFKLQVFSSFHKHVRRFFSDPRLIALMEFPILFLGAMPKSTPALYSLMNYSGLKMGTYYPMGGMSKVTDAFVAIGKELGVNYYTNTDIDSASVNNGVLESLKDSAGHIHKADAVIAALDYNHFEQNVLPKEYRNYSPQYWEKRTFAPSSLLFYVGINKKLDKLNHHNLFFDADLEQHAYEIYKSKVWPKDPLCYVCCPSRTDSSVAPEGKENIFILMPIAPGLEDTQEIRQKYFERLIKKIENYCGESITDHIEYKRSYCVTDFEDDYNSFKGNAYGLANTLEQTAVLKPKMWSKKVSNLLYAGQLTVPGPGVPPSIISGQVACNELVKLFDHTLIPI